MSKEMLKVEDLSYSYEEKELVLNSLSFSMEEGETVGVIGPNGAGKTTLFMSICGILHLTQGKVIIQDEEAKSKSFNPLIGYVFQNCNDQLFSPSVWDDVAFGPINMGFDQAQVEEKVKKTLDICGVSHVSSRSSHHLSGGEKRMVAMASVLSLDPKIVIYDEPTSNLDMRSRRRVMNLIKNSKQTNLIASHDLELISELCSRVILIDQGKILADGDSSQVMSDGELMDRSGLEVPHSLRK